MLAGKLDRRIQFLRAELIDDGYQERMGDYEPLGLPVWSSKADVSDGERFSAGTVDAQITTRFQIRSSEFSRGIRSTDRLHCEGVEYGIVGIKEIGRRDGLEITAKSL